MTKIEVHYVATVVELTGKYKETFTLTEPTVQAVVEKIVRMYGGDLEVLLTPENSFYMIFVNGDRIVFNAFSKSLQEGDMLAIIPPVSGG